MTGEREPAKARRAARFLCGRCSERQFQSTAAVCPLRHTESSTTVARAYLCSALLSICIALPRRSLCTAAGSVAGINRAIAARVQGVVGDSCSSASLASSAVANARKVRVVVPLSISLSLCLTSPPSPTRLRGASRHPPRPAVRPTRSSHAQRPRPRRPPPSTILLSICPSSLCRRNPWAHDWLPHQRLLCPRLLSPPPSTRFLFFTHTPVPLKSPPPQPCWTLALHSTVCPSCHAFASSPRRSP